MGKRARGKTPSMPPELETVLTIGHTFRFANGSAATNVVISVAQLAAICGGVCTAANSTVRYWASAIRIRKVTIWPSASTSAVSNPEVVWFGAGTLQTKDESKIRTIPSGITLDRPVVSVPPKDTLAREWQTTASGSSTVMQISAPAGSVTDIAISFNLSNNLGTNTWNPAAASLGGIYYARLDGVGGVFLPLGVPTTN